ncbi:MAG: OmpA family protein [Flavobacteriales bacterium]
MKRLIFTLVVLTFLFTSCRAPFVYTPQPLFLNQQDFSQNQSQRVNQPALTISRIETQERTVRLHVHLLDADGNFISGMPNNVSLWCSLVNNFAGTNHQITDFRVFEDRFPQDVPTAYSLVLDHSGSMSGRVNEMQQAVSQFIVNKRPMDAISIVKYDEKSILEVPLSTDVNFLLGSFRANGLTGYGGLTAIQNGIHEGIQSLINSPYRRRVVISFTDGGDNRSTFTQQYVTWLAQSNNIQISTIDLGRSVNQNYMRSIAGQTSGTYNYMMFASEFPGVFTDIQNRLNQSYIIEYTAPGIGQHSVQLTACLQTGQLVASGFFTNEPVSNVAPIRDAIPPKNTPRSDGKPFVPPRNTQVQGGTIRDMKGNQGGTKPNRGTTAQSGQVRDLKGNPGGTKPNRGATNQSNQVRDVKGGQGGVKPNRGVDNQANTVGANKGNSRPADNNQATSNPVRDVKGSTDNTNPGNTTNPSTPSQSNPVRNNQSGNVSNPTPSNQQGGIARPGNQTNTPNNQGAAQEQTGGIARPSKQGNTSQPSAGTTVTENTGGIARPGRQESTPSANNASAGAINTGNANIPVFGTATRPTANSTFLIPAEFKLNSADIVLNNNINAIFNQLAQSLTANPNLKVRIVSHIDNGLQPQQALNVTNNRALAIRAQLVQRGIAEGRIETQGMGSAEPVADNSTPQGRAQNNRIVAFFFQ